MISHGVDVLAGEAPLKYSDITVKRAVLVPEPVLCLRTWVGQQRCLPGQQYGIGTRTANKGNEAGNAGTAWQLIWTPGMLSQEHVPLMYVSSRQRRGNAKGTRIEYI